MATTKKRKSKQTPEPSPLQRLVTAALSEQGVSRCKFAESIGVRPNHVYQRLSRPYSHNTLERMLAAMGATVTIGRRSVQLGLRDGAVVGRVQSA